MNNLQNLLELVEMKNNIENLISESVSNLSDEEIQIVNINEGVLSSAIKSLSPMVKKRGSQLLGLGLVGGAALKFGAPDFNLNKISKQYGPAVANMIRADISKNCMAKNLGFTPHQGLRCKTRIMSRYASKYPV